MTKLTLSQFNQQIESLEITNDEQLENANYLAKECNRLIKEVKDNHKEEIANYHKLHKQAKEKEKEDLAPLENAKNILKTAIGDYMKILKQRQLEEQKALLKQQEEEKELFGEVITTETTKQVPKLNGTHVRKTWKARIIDESKVPVMFGNHVIRPIDLSKLNDIAKFEKGNVQIDGVEFYEEESVVIR